MLAEYYRCPARHDRFITAGQSSGASGYFRFGNNTTCYGRLFSGHMASILHENLHDARGDVAIEGSTVRLSFIPEEIVDNLRCEKYTRGFPGSSTFTERAVRSAYYHVRPLLPVAARKHLQRIRLRDWNKLLFPTWPVDTTVESIHRQLLAMSLQADGCAETPFIWFWPDGWNSCAIMTHDVETSSGRDTCSRLMNIDESFNIRSSFQIVPERRYLVPKTFLNSIRARGFEVNIHDLNHDGFLFADRKEFVRRAKRINQHAADYGAEGFRSAALYRNPQWFDALSVSYDMSIPNVGHLDNQRGGCCTVMPYFIGPMLELPVTTTQDYTLFHILRDYSIDLWKAQIDLIIDQHGLISFIAHPDYLVAPRALATYVSLLKHLSQLRSEGKVWIALPGEVNTWWRQRSRMTLEFSDGAWRIQGEGKERARVAYASLGGDTVAYRVDHASVSGSRLHDVAFATARIH